jgi:hypothetical protein
VRNSSAKFLLFTAAGQHSAIARDDPESDFVSAPYQLTQFDNLLSLVQTLTNSASNGSIKFTNYSSSSNLDINGYSTTISNHKTYTFKKLIVENCATVNFTPGDYYMKIFRSKVAAY